MLTSLAEPKCAPSNTARRTWTSVRCTSTAKPCNYCQSPMNPEPKSKLPRLVSSAPPAAWMRYFEPSAGNSPEEESGPRALFLVAHPDDETIGASAALSRLPRSVVVYLTDGAPHDPRLWSSPSSSREEYARTRLEEARAALALTGISGRRIFGLGAADQDAIYEVPVLVEQLIQIVRWF